MPHVIGPGIHVRDVARSTAFYTECLGMKVVAHFEGSVEEVAVSYGDDMDASCLILVGQSNHPEPYELGDALRKLVISVDDVREMCKRVAAWGCVIDREPVELPKWGQLLAFILDPDGYRVELVQPL